MTAFLSTNLIKRANRSVHGESKVHQSATGTVAIAVAPVVNDTYAFVDLPPWARIVGAELDADQLDTNGSPAIAFKVGDSGFTGGLNGTVAADTARYFSATTVGRVAGPANANATAAMDGKAQNFWNAQPTTLRVFATCTTIAATFQAGNLRFRVTYFIDEPPSNLNQ